MSPSKRSDSNNWRSRPALETSASASSPSSSSTSPLSPTPASSSGTKAPSTSSASSSHTPSATPPLSTGPTPESVVRAAPSERVYSSWDDFASEGMLLDWASDAEEQSNAPSTPPSSQASESSPAKTWEDLVNEGTVEDWSAEEEEVEVSSVGISMGASSSDESEGGVMVEEAQGEGSHGQSSWFYQGAAFSSSMDASLLGVLGDPRTNYDNVVSPEMATGSIAMVDVLILAPTAITPGIVVSCEEDGAYPFAGYRDWSMPVSIIPWSRIPGEAERWGQLPLYNPCFPMVEWIVSTAFFTGADDFYANWDAYWGSLSVPVIAENHEGREGGVPEEIEAAAGVDAWGSSPPVSWVSGTLLEVVEEEEEEGDEMSGQPIPEDEHAIPTSHGVPVDIGVEIESLPTPTPNTDSPSPTFEDPVRPVAPSDPEPPTSPTPTVDTIPDASHISIDSLDTTTVDDASDPESSPSPSPSEPPVPSPIDSPTPPAENSHTGFRLTLPLVIPVAIGLVVADRLLRRWFR